MATMVPYPGGGDPFSPPLTNLSSTGTPPRAEGHKALAAYVVSKFVTWKAARIQLEIRWLEYYRTYRCLEDAQDAQRNSERSMLKVPLTKEAITNFVISAMGTLFPVDPWFQLAPTNPPNDRPHVAAQFIRYLMNRDRFEETARTLLTEMGIYGTCIGRIRPVKDVHQTIVRNQIPPQPVIDPATGQVLDVLTPPPSVERQETEYIHPRLDPVSIFNFYTNPVATGPGRRESDGVIARSWLSRNQLQQMKAEGTIDRLPLLPSDTPGPVIDQSDNLYRRLASTGIAATADSDHYTVLEWHGYIPPQVLRDAGIEPETTPEGVEMGKEMVLYVCNDQVLNDNMEPPLWYGDRPFVVGWFERIPGEFYGRGITESARGPQKALDATVRARMDNLAISLNVTGAVNRNKLAPNENLNWYPGKMLQLTCPPSEAISFLQVPDVTGSTYPASAEYERWIQAAHGVQPSMGGRATKRGEQTATEVSTLMGQAASLVKEICRSFENNVLEPTLRWYARILFQFPNPQEAFYVLGQNGQMVFQTIENADIASDLEFIPMGVIQTDMAQQAQKILNVLSATANPLDAPWVNRPLLLQRYFEAQGFPDARQLVIAPPVHPMIQSMLQQQAMQGGPGAGSPPAPEGAPAGSGPGERQPGGMMEAPTAPGGSPNVIE